MIKRVASYVSLALILFTISATGGADATQSHSVEKLGWIAGCWSSDDGKERIEEFWFKPAGQAMIGMSRTIAGGKTVFVEYAQIAEAKGEIAYNVSLGLGKPPVSFKLIRSSDKEAIFENSAHDFPQRIIYRRISEDALFARIEGKDKGVEKGIDFNYKRSRCD